MKAKITNIEYPVRYDAAVSCEAFRQHARVTYQSPCRKDAARNAESLTVAPELNIRAEPK
jgi:hypothetical protein